MKEDILLERYEGEILSYFKTGRKGEFAGKKNKIIRYIAFNENAAKGAILFLHGAHETFIKYAEFVYDLRESGYAVFLMDHRGHGLSERLLDPSEDKMHVENYKYYIEDVKTLYGLEFKPKGYAKKIIMAHSMGGGIASAYLERYQADFDKAVLCSPLHKLETGNMSETAAWAVTSLLSMLGLGKKYSPGQGPREEGSFETNIINHSPARWEIWEQKIMQSHPEVHFGGATNSWVSEIIKMSRYVRKNAPRLKLPILLLMAGDDKFVRKEGQEEFASKAKNVEKHVFDGAYHELLTEKDEIRNEVIEKTINFINN